MRGLLLALCAMVVACSQKKQHEPPPSPPPTSSVESAAPFVPDAVLAAFGDSNTVFAIDLGSLHLINALPMFGNLPCAAQLLSSAGVGVFALGDSVQGYMSKMPEEATKTCLATVGPTFGVHPETEGRRYTLVGKEGGRYTLAWEGWSTLNIQEANAHPSGKLAPMFWERAKKLPRDIRLWVISRDFMGHGVGTAWAKLDDQNAEYLIEIDGKPEELQPVLEEFRQGIENFYTQRGMQMDDKWAVITTAARSSKLTGTIPLSVFVESNRRGNEALRQSPQSPRP
jgi:hypothetical protein